MYRWLGWLVIAGLASAAGAAPVRHPTATTSAGRPAAAAHPGSREPARRDPLPPESPARPRAIATAAREPAREIAELKAFTSDGVLGKADRIDGDEATGLVAFTFDDGPNPETTPAVIDALEKYDVPAAFFIVTRRLAGKHGEPARQILQRELDAGFLVGSHSVTHPSLKKAVGDKLHKEIDASVRALAVQANRPIGMFRPPYGSLSGAGRVRLKKLGLTEVLWSVDTLDWKAHDPARLRKKVISMIKKDGGGVVLMHDVKSITATIIADVLDDLEAENCARLADHREPIVPVSLHYFVKDGKAPRAIPDAVKQRTDAYRAGLADRCAKRPPPPEPAAPKHAAKEQRGAATKATPSPPFD